MDTDFFKLKASAIQKIEGILKNTEQEVFRLLQNTKYVFPHGTLLKSGKISRGENYNGYPFLILDYPRLNSSESLFLFRTMFWWGNFFSSTLHIKGKFFEEIKENMINAKDRFSGQNSFVFKGEDEWVHDLNHSSYFKVNTLTQNEWADILKSQSFLKISVKTDLKAYSEVSRASLELLSNFLSLSD